MLVIKMLRLSSSIVTPSQRLLQTISTAPTTSYFALHQLGVKNSDSKLTSSNSQDYQLKSFHTSCQDFAARKGTRARKAKGKVKKEETVRRYLTRRLNPDADLIYINQRPLDRSGLPEAIDDVYFYSKFQDKQWSFAEAVENHKETLHPTVYNVPNSPLILRIDMDFRYPNRPNKCMDKWRSLVEMKSPFLLPGMEYPTILAIVPNEPEYILATQSAGATIAGGSDIIKQIQLGEILPNDYEFILCHNSMIPELTSVRGLIKKNFPAMKNKTIDSDVPKLVQKFRNGIKINVIHDDREPDYAYIETPIGSTEMSAEELESNFFAIFKDTVERRVSGKNPNDFIIKVSLKSPDSFEVFRINVSKYIEEILASAPKKGQKKEIVEEVEEDNEEKEKISATA